MVTNATTLYKVNTLCQHHVGVFSQDKACYDQVRSDFLKQSTKYLRESFFRTGASGLGAR
jgi:hypothetical protein